MGTGEGEKKRGQQRRGIGRVPRCHARELFDVFTSRDIILPSDARQSFGSVPSQSHNLEERKQ